MIAHEILPAFLRRKHFDICALHSSQTPLIRRYSASWERSDEPKQKDRPKAALYSNCKLGALVVRAPQRRIYFGRIVGSPPGLPGGGMTGILPVSGVGARISGSTPVGGQNTPSDLASLSLSGSARGSVVVVPCGAMVPCCGIDCVGAQPVAFLAGAGGAV